MSPAVNKPLPRQFGKYELLEYLGGGMADVYRARDIVLGKIVAVKILKQEGSADPDVRARFLDEARTAASFNHDNIINVFDFGEHEGEPFMVMEFLRGEDLGTLIHKGRTSDTATKLKIALQIASALELIHEHDIVHRDIKPANIHVNQSGVAKLIDFGIAKRPDASVKTQTGFAVGTLYYMAPEQVLGKTTRLVDIYAFGLVLYELMCGHRAVTPDTMERTFYKILHEPIDLKPVETCASPEIADLVRRCTAKSPEERIQSFTEIRRDLERIAGNALGPTMTFSHGAVPQVVPQAPKPALEPHKQRSRSVLAPLLGALLLVAAGGGVWWWLAHRNVAAATDRKLRALEQTGAQLPATFKDPSGDMVLVPKGRFLFGPNNTAAELPDFYIDRTEVTNRAYSRYCAARKMPKPKGNHDIPVTNVTFNEAQSFCEWADKRLPSMEQWQKAARGTDGRLYPWGNDADAARANVVRASGLKKALLPVGSFPEGASPYGALNMAGNVWEYVLGTRNPVPQSIAMFRNLVKPPCSVNGEWVRVVGGSYLEPISNAVSNDFMEVPACYRSADYGFRCAKQP